MEIFVDGGLFELAIAASFGYAINFIFRKKYLLIAFSIIVLLSPVTLIFIRTGEPYNWLISVCLINAILLVILLWKERLNNHNKPLFDLSVFKRKFLKKESKNASEAQINSLD